MRVNCIMCPRDDGWRLPLGRIEMLVDHSIQVTNIPMCSILYICFVSVTSTLYSQIFLSRTLDIVKWAGTYPTGLSCHLLRRGVLRHDSDPWQRASLLGVIWGLPPFVVCPCAVCVVVCVCVCCFRGSLWSVRGCSGPFGASRGRSGWARTIPGTLVLGVSRSHSVITHFTALSAGPGLHCDHRDGVGTRHTARGGTGHQVRCYLMFLLFTLR